MQPILVQKSKIMVFSIKKILIGVTPLIASFFAILPAQAEFSLVHKAGMYDALQENGMQAVHTETQILYAKPGEWVYLYRPERASMISYVRWYNYDTDRAIPKNYSVDESPATDKSGNPVAATRIESTWAKDTAANNPKFKAYNDYGWFAYDYASDRVTTSDVSYIEIKYRMHKGDSVYRIACDESIWKDGFSWSASGAVIEPTLSKRIVYEIHPASEMAERMEPYKDMDGTNDRFLEEYDMIAPTGRQLYIGPEYMYHTKKVTLKQYTCYARSNYYYINSQGNVTAASTNNNWKWYKNGVEDPSIVLPGTAAQFAPMSSNTPGTIVYELKYNSATGVYFNVARYRVTYVDQNIVGPALSLPATTKKMDKIYEQTFNFERPGTTNFAFWLGHLDVDESTYGYYNKNLDGSPSQRKIRQGNVTWSEYAITNRKQVWVDSGTAPQVYQHVDSTENVANNAKEGYMLYVDGSQQPGLVFDLKVSADLCPGATMYFTAWLCDVSSEKSGNNGRSAPNMDFEVTGVDSEGGEHALTIFTTGEFGINAPEDLSQGAWSNTNRMERAKWHQIMFPVQFTAETTYPSYRLRIRNKSTSSDGNDFAIDDIRIYVQKPPVRPIQASSYDCPTNLWDSITAYLRVDYQAIDDQQNTFYYQWRDGDDEAIRMPYFNGNNGDVSTYGRIVLPESEEAVIAAGDTCSSLLSFDAKYYDTEVPLVKYVKEFVDASTERYVMYIAQPMYARTNFKYTGYVAIRPEDLGSETGCGTKAELLIAGGTRILINGEALGDSVVDICGSRSYTLDIVLTYIARNEETDALEEYTTPCRADWLIGDSTYVNANPDVYRYTFRQIEQAVEDYRTSDPTQLSKTIVRHLLRNNLLVLNSASTIMQPSLSLSYTAFPINGSATNGMSVCLTPRFLHLNPGEAIVNMMKVGNSAEELPQAVKDRPRIVRISNAQKKSGKFQLPLFLEGDPGEEYRVDSIYIVSSTYAGWRSIRLNSDKEVIGLIDTVTLSGTRLSTLKEGYDYTFHMAFIGESAEDKCNRGYTYFTLRIVPDVVTWQGGEWNEDDSWDSFIPMRETDVILLEDKDYNVRFDEESMAQYDINYTENHCHHIYFPDGASMAGQEHVNIHGQAFIDVKEYAWKWTLTSIPIQGVVTGDLFVSAHESTKPFVVAPINQTVGEYAEDRVKWQVYHKEYDAEKDKWKVATNTTTRPMLAGDANMVGIDCENNDVDPIIRLPKQDNMYRYYEKNQQVWMIYNENITRDEATYGKPAWNGDKDITLKQVFENIYLLGNPTFGYINISKLVEDNEDKLTGKYYLEPVGATTIPKKDEMISFNRDVSTDEYDVLLPPYRGVLLEGKAASSSLTINIDASLVNPEGRNAPLRRMNHQNEIATDIQSCYDSQGVQGIYDLLGRRVGSDIRALPDGVYIIMDGVSPHKIVKKK